MSLADQYGVAVAKAGDAELQCWKAGSFSVIKGLAHAMFTGSDILLNPGKSVSGSQWTNLLGATLEMTRGFLNLSEHP